MQIIKRKIESEITEVKTKLHCQASFNSDGVITLRHYTPYEKGTDDIIVFSDGETKAIIRLFEKISDRISGNGLPF
jgi:hypothetical protein